MEAGAAIFMLISWSGVLALTGFCFYRVLTSNDETGRRKK
jgi:hypothetical protein